MKNKEIKVLEDKLKTATEEFDANLKKLIEESINITKDQYMTAIQKLQEVVDILSGDLDEFDDDGQLVSGGEETEEVDVADVELNPPTNGRDRPDEDFDANELKRGIEVEGEHTTDPEEAKNIAKDHLAEIPDYYTRLDKMEKDAEAKLNDEEPEKTEEPANESDDIVIDRDEIANVDIISSNDDGLKAFLDKYAEKVDQSELKKGTDIEAKKHGLNKLLATKFAMDNLLEDSDYYKDTDEEYEEGAPPLISEKANGPKAESVEYNTIMPMDQLLDKDSFFLNDIKNLGITYEMAEKNPQNNICKVVFSGTPMAIKNLKLMYFEEPAP